MRFTRSGNATVSAVNSDGRVIGLDIGAKSVRAAVLRHQVVKGEAGVTVLMLGSVDLPPGVVSQGAVIDQAAVTRAVRQLAIQCKFSGRNVILGIANPQSVVRDLEMPALSADQLAKALPYQAREIVAIPIEQALLDFIPLGRTNLGGDMTHGLLVAVPRAPVLAAVFAVEKAGLSVARVDLSSFAVLRSVAGSDRDVEAVVDMGAQLTNVIIHRQGVPKVVRSVPRGGAEISARVADRTGLEDVEAEEAKCLHGLTGSNTDVVDAVTDGIRPVLAEIRSSIQYFASTNGNATPQRLSLTGGAANLPGLAELLGDQLNIETVVAEPLRHISNRESWAATAPANGAQHSDSAASAVSLGLAMGAAA